MQLADPVTETRENIWETRAKLARVNPWYFLRYFARTLDEHDETGEPKPFPARAITRIICRGWQEFPLLFIEKSRQVFMTWTISSLHLWDAMFKKGRRHFFRSKKQEDANNVLDRIRFVYDALAEMNFPDLPKARNVAGRTGTGDKIEFPDNRSIIWAVPQGATVVHSYTSSGIFDDEIAFQPEAKMGYEGAQPTVTGGGKYCAVSTPNGKVFNYLMMYAIDELTMKKVGENLIDSNKITHHKYEPPRGLNEEEQRWWWEDLLLDMDDEEFQKIPFVELAAMAPGVRYWRNAMEVDVLSVHYSADPYKSPETAIGRAWMPEAKKGISPAGWRRQYEIDYETFEGRPVISNWSYPLFVKDPDYDPAQTLYMSIDFGKNCGCVFAQAVKIAGFNSLQLRIIDEIFLQESNTVELVEKIIQRMEGSYFDSWNRRDFKVYCDPAGYQERETTNDRSRNSSIKILKGYGLKPQAKKFGLSESMDHVEIVFAKTLPDGQLAISIHRRCEYLISCLKGGWRYPEKGIPGHPEKDGYYEHGGDMIRYLICNMFPIKELTPRLPKRKTMVPVREKYSGRIIAWTPAPQPVRGGRHPALP